MITGVHGMMLSAVMLLLCRPEVNAYNRIAGGKTASVGDFPYVVFLLNKKDPTLFTKYKYTTCTGSIIHPKWILTAAHCLRYSLSVTVSAGVAERDGGDQSKLQVRESAKLIMHPEYMVAMDPGSKKRYFDYGLVKLRDSLDIDNISVGLIQIESSPWDETRRRRNCTAVGFGKTPTESRGVLYSVDLDVMHGNYRCPCKHKNVEVEHYICTIADEHRRTTCSGDSGGPLVCDNREAGVTSFHYSKDQCNLFLPESLKITGCGIKGNVNIFLHLCPVLYWIREHVGSTVPSDC